MISQDYYEGDIVTNWAGFFDEPQTQTRHTIRRRPIPIEPPLPFVPPPRRNITPIGDNILPHPSNPPREPVGSNAPRLSDFLDTTSVRTNPESRDLHKFGLLMEAAYKNYYGGLKGVEEHLQHPDHSYIEELKDFRVDEELSSRDDLVLHNPKTGETVISYRGTDPPSWKDWSINSRIAFGRQGGQGTQRYKNAERLAEEVIRLYGRVGLFITGHSQGGGISSHIGQKFDIAGIHFDPAVSYKQVIDNARGVYENNTAEQQIFRPRGDMVSMNSLFRSIGKNFKVNIVNPVQETRGDFVSVHNPTIFHPRPIGTTEDGQVLVTRKTATASASEVAGFYADAGLKGAGLALGMADLVFKSMEAHHKTRGIVDKKTRDGVEKSAEVLGTTASFIDAPAYSGINSSADDIAYFLDRTGITNSLKSKERKREEEEMAFNRYAQEVLDNEEGDLLTFKNPTFGASDEETQQNIKEITSNRTPNKNAKEFKNEAGQTCFYIGNKLYCEGG